MSVSEKIKSLQKRGVTVLGPETVFVEQSVPVDHIAPGAVIHPGCRIRGSETTVGPESVIGEEGPVTLDNCQLGRKVQLKGGYFCNATFLDNVSYGSCAHVRPGTLMEEESSAAHCVGMKQTILMPFVTLGSMINLCDCLVAGGTDRKNYTEVGSSFVHFNFTPHRDKATASLIGDVPRGVMLRQRPIFLGGQSGLVGPIRVEYGNIVAAGSIWRKDILDHGHIFSGHPHFPGPETPYEAAIYHKIDRILKNNLIYIGNILALREWYHEVRSQFMTADRWQRACHTGALRRITEALDERLKRMTELSAKVENSMNVVRRTSVRIEKAWMNQQRDFVRSWPAVEERIRKADFSGTASVQKCQFITELARYTDLGYIEAVRNAENKTCAAGSRWLQAIVDFTVTIKE